MLLAFIATSFAIGAAINGLFGHNKAIVIPLCFLAGIIIGVVFALMPIKIEQNKERIKNGRRQNQKRHFHQDKELVG